MMSDFDFETPDLSKMHRSELEGAVVSQAKVMDRLVHCLANVVEGLEDEGDRVYLQSTNDAETLQDIKNKMLYWGYELHLDYMHGTDLYGIIAAKTAEIERLRAERDNAVRQAQQWKVEAMSHKASLNEAYQAVTGSTGEPGNWNGANPIVEAIAQKGGA